MAKRSSLDLELGDDIRARRIVPCPQCAVPAVWHSVSELEAHLRSCRVIALGLAVGKLELPPLDDLLPEVPKKAQGWDWGRR